MNATAMRPFGPARMASITRGLEKAAAYPDRCRSNFDSYRSLLKRPSTSEGETNVLMPRPVLEKKSNGQGLSGGRSHRAAETDVLF